MSLRVGDRVRVRPLEEILKTLDARGRLDELPFMPEMISACGREFTVLRRVDRVNDRVDRTGLRRMRDAVILDRSRCDGASHGGCQALCQSIFKEAWLARAEHPVPEPIASASGCTEASLLRATQRKDPSGELRFVCQATEMKRASRPLAWWDPGQYVRDLRSGNVSPGEMLRVFFLSALEWLMRVAPPYRLWRALHRSVYRLYRRTPYLEQPGRLNKTPHAELHLRPGELVRVKSYEEILATLDGDNKNRGLRFDVEMIKYCGGTFPVLLRVEQIIDEPSGRMIKLPRDCIILEGVTTQGDHHRFYAQNEYPFWREIWLARAGGSGRPAPTRNDAATSN